jgi:hypothetical protein
VRRYAADELVFDGRGHLVMLEAGWESRALQVLDWAGTVSVDGRR